MVRLEYYKIFFFGKNSFFLIKHSFIGKTHVPHRIDKTFGKSLYRGSNPHLMNQFLKMSQASNFIMVSKPLQDPLSHLLSSFRYRVTHHLCPRTKPKSVGRDGGCIGKTQVPHRIDKNLDKNLYRGGNPHLTSRFCKDELDSEFHYGIRACRIQGPSTDSRTEAQRVLGVTGVYWENSCSTSDR